MKQKMYWITATILGVGLAFSAHAFAQEVDHKAGYEKQMKECAETQKVIDGVVQWLKDHNYEKYPVAKETVDDAMDQASYAEETKKKAEEFAGKGDWEKAHGWSVQYYQYQVKVATEGLMAKKMVEDAEASAQQQ